MENNKAQEELSENDYWNDSYCSIAQLPIVLSLDSIGMSRLNKVFRKHLPKNSNFDFLELGCSPGGWMHYFAKNFSYHVSGVDYAKDGVIVTKKNLELLGVKSKVEKEDVFTYKAIDKFDVVFSAGLVEHFSGNKLKELIDKHIELCKNGGYIVITIPNLCGLNGFFQRIASKDVFDIHNIGIMSQYFFENIGKERSASIQSVFVGYVGGFDFGLFNGKLFLLRIGYFLQAVINFFVLKLRIPISESRHTSPYIVAIFQKNA